METEESVVAVERAMIAIRRSQTRRALGAAAGSTDPNSVLVLDVLEEGADSGATCTVATVSAALSVDQPRASRLVAAAVAAGLVDRAADPDDARRTRLTMTEEGRALLDQVHAFRRRRFAAAMDGWPARDTARFAELLTRFVAAFRA